MGKSRVNNLFLAVALAGGVWPSISAGKPSRLPALPVVVPSKFPLPIRNKVQEAYAAARSHPHDPEANGALGMLLQSADKSDNRAEICYRRAYSIDPTSFRWTYYLGALQVTRGEFTEAADTLRQALRLDPGYLPAQLKLGESLLASGNAREARNLHEQIILQHGDSAQAFYDLGRARQAEGDPNGAIESFRKACELFPNFGSAHYALALAYRRQGKAQQAQTELALYEKNKYDIPGVDDPILAKISELYIDPESLIQSGIEFAKQGKLEQAVAESEKALKVDPKFFKAHVNLISFYGRLHEFKKAEEHYRDAVRISPKNPESYYNYGLLLLQQGSNVQAKEEFRKVLEIDPVNAEALNDMGYVLERQDKLEEAIAAYRRAIESKPDFRQAHFNLGRVLVNQGKYAEGIEHLQDTLAPEDDNTARYLYALGAAYGRAGDRAGALLYLRKAQARASAQGQSQVLADIERDLHSLEGEPGRP